MPIIDTPDDIAYLNAGTAPPPGQDDMFSGNVDWGAWQTPPVDNVPTTPDGALNPTLVPDGFSYNVRTKYLPYRSFMMQLRLLDDYRRAAVQTQLWQPRWYPVPPTLGQVIPAGDQFIYDQRMAIGSVIYGYSFYCAPTNGASINSMRLSLLDAENNYELTASAATGNKFVRAATYRPDFTGGGVGNGFPCVLASEPYKMCGHAILRTILVNTGPVDAVAQLLVMVLEPGGSPQ